MGTTIHAHIEVKKDGKWFHYSEPNVGRNYLLFVLINGVDRENCLDYWRRFVGDYDFKQCASIEGIPEDASELTKYCYEKVNEEMTTHHPGVLTSSDLEKLQEELINIRTKYWLRVQNDEIEPNDKVTQILLKTDLESDLFNTYILMGAISQHRGFDDSRIVFWYDN